ncbi:MAG: choice-of-anchor D domain-containing protein [Cyclobacteriaceae bacterium]
MKQSLRAIATGLILFTVCLTGESQSYRKGVIHVKFKEGAVQQFNQFKNAKQTVAGTLATGNVEMDRVSQRHKTTSITRVFRAAGKFEAAHEQFGLHLWYEIQFDSTKSLSTVIRDYQDLGHFQKVESVQKITQIESVKKNPFENPILTTPANDPSFSKQWHYKNTGQTGGKIGADISLEQAWQVETGKTNVIVAVIDGGIDNTHPDLKAALWVNAGEIPANGIDDDKNGYVDDINGYGFGDNTGTISPHFHGTHVAGTIGAVTNNSVGVSGIAGGSGSGDGVRLMSCAGFGAFGTGGFENAMVYAADNGAVISQNSWGGGSSAIEAAIDYFVARAGYDNTTANFSKNIQTGPMAGGIVIFAAGNSNSENPANGYPGSYAPVFAVASTDHNDVRSSFSNYGTWVEIAAPGSNVYSTYPVTLGSYAYLSGTSMACPHVSGVAGLIVSKFGGPGFLASQVRDRLMASADNIDALNPSFIGKLGAGRLNANNALQINDGIAPDPITDLAIQVAGMNSITLSWTATGGSGKTGAASFYDLRYSTSAINATNFSSATRITSSPKPLASGSSESFKVTGLANTTTYYFAIKAGDFFGNISTISNAISGATLPPPVISVSPLSFTESLLTGASIQKFLTITNTGASALEFDISIKNTGTTSITSTNIIPPYRASTVDEYKKRGSLNLNKSIVPTVSSQPSSPVLLAGGKLFSLAASNEILELNPSTGSVIKRIPAPEAVSGGPDGLAYDGQYLYFVNGFGTQKIYRINPSDGTVAKSITISSITSMDGLGHNGKYLYVLSYSAGLIYEIDFDTGTVNRTINPGVSIGGGLSFGGSRGTIFVSNFSSGIYEIDAAKGTVINQFTPTGTIYGLGYSNENGLLFAENVSNGTIEAYNPDTGKVVFSYTTTYSAALASDEAGSSWLKPIVTTKNIAAGQSLQVPLIFDANGLIGGVYKKIISVQSNDPVKPTIDIPVTLTVTGAPNIIVSESSLKFEDTFINTTKTKTLSVSNNGTDNLSVTGLAFDNALFSCSVTSFILTPGQKKDLTINFIPLTAGAKTGTLSISSNDPDLASATVSLQGLAITPPVVGVTPTSITSNLFTGGLENKAITIGNTGGSALNFNTQIEFITTTSQATGTIAPQASSSPNNNGVVTPSEESKAYPLAVGDFTKKADSSFPLTSMTVDPTTNLIYAQRNNGTDFYSYNPSTNIWTTLSSCPLSSGNNGGAAYLGGKIYTIYSEGSQMGLYDIASNSWTVMSSPLSTGNITSDGTYLYAVAGSQFVRYNSSTKLWDNLPAPPFSFSSWGGLVSDAGSIYGHQGNSGTGFAKYVITSQTWTTLPSLPNGGVLGAAIDPSTKTYYAYGSYFGNNFYSFDISSNAWSVASIPLFSVNDGGLVNINQSSISGIYFIQGESGNGLGRYETKPGSNWLSLTPTSGTVGVGSTSSVTASISAKGLVGGTYKASVKIINNDPITPSFSIPVTLNVTSASDIRLDKTNLDFGQVFTNQTKTIAITVVNEGASQLSVSALAFNSALFTTTASPFNLSPGLSTTIPIAFKPTATGTFAAQLSISSNDPDESTKIVTLNGVAVDPPAIEVTPTSITQALNSGQTISRIINIKNKGVSKLLFSSDISDVAQTTSSAATIQSLPSYSYIVASTIDGLAKPAQQVKELKTELLGLGGVKVGHLTEGPITVLMGDIRSRGGLSAVLTIPLTAAKLDTLDIITIDDTIALLSSADLDLLKNWMKAGGGLVLMADNSASMTSINYLLTGTGITETSVLFTSATFTNIKSHPTTVGVVQVQADLYGSYATVVAPAQAIVFDDLSRPHIAVSNLSLGKVITIGNELMADFEIGFVDNRKFSNQIIDWLVSNTWISMPVTSGEILAGQSIDLDVALNATTLFEGVYTANVVINSNDPINNKVTVPVKLNVTGIPKIEVTPSSLDFGSKYVGATSALPITIKNTGTKPLSISSISSSSTTFTHNGSVTVLVPGISLSFNVTFSPTKAGSFPAKLTITSNDPDKSSLDITLLGIAVDPPIIGISPLTINKIMLTNAQKSETITVINTGGSNLDYSTQIEFIQPASISSSVGTIVPQASNQPNNSGIIPPPVELKEYPLAVGDFTQKASSSFPLTCMTVDPVSNLIYAQQNQGTGFYSFNPATNTWITLQPCPLSSANNGGAAYLDGKIYTVYTQLSQMGIYNINGNSWTTVSLPFSTGNLTSDGISLYAAVGTLFSRYNPTNGLWTTLTAPPISFQSWGGLAFSEGFIYGHEGNGLTGFAKYSLSSQTWTVLASVPGGAVLGSAIDPVTKTYYTYGSYSGNNFYSYDISTGSWKIATIPFFSVSDGGLVYASQPSANPGIYFLQGELGNGLGRFETKQGLNWLAVDPGIGSITSSASQTSQFNFNTNNLPLGNYKANVIFNSNAPASPKVTVQVNLTVANFVNTPPSVIKPIADRLLKVGSSFIIKLDSIFTDVDTQALTYTASTTNSGKVSTSLSGDILSISGVSNGEVIITATATDTYSAQVSTTFKVKVDTNSPPVVSIPIANQSIVLSKTMDINLAQVFSDPDSGQMLTFTTQSSAPTIATVSVIGSVLKIDSKAIGATTITAKATDPYGESVNTSFILTVVTNALPKVVNPIANQIIRLDKTMDINLAQVFSDSDIGQILTYTIQSSAANIAKVSILGSVLKIEPQAIGSTTITAKAIDPYSEFVTSQFTLTVIPKNEAPTIKETFLPIELKIIDGKKDSVIVELGGHFSDPNQDALTYSLSLSNSSIVNLKQAGSKVTLYANQLGSTQIIVTAKDQDNLFITQEFKAEVTIVTGIEPVLRQTSLTLAPNPVSTIASISYSLESDSFANLEIYDLQGRRINTLVNSEQAAGDHKIDFSTESISSGSYVIQLVANSKILIQKMIVIK